MYALVAAEAAKPGSIIPILDRDSFVWLLPYSRSPADGPSVANARALHVTFDLGC